MSSRTLPQLAGALAVQSLDAPVSRTWKGPRPPSRVRAAGV